MNHPKNSNKLLIGTTILALVLSAAVAFANSIQFFSAIADQPPNTEYLGTVHYYQDYFFYINHFFQGAHGGWLTQNQYTSEPTSASVLFWSNLIMGKIGGALSMPPAITYNLGLMIASFATLVLSLLLLLKLFNFDPIKTFVAFLLSTFATSWGVFTFQNNTYTWSPYILWRTPHTMFNRLGGIPHHVVSTFLFLGMAGLFYGNDVRGVFFAALLGILLTPLNSVMSLMFLAAAWTAWSIDLILSWLMAKHPLSATRDINLRAKFTYLPRLIFVSVAIGIAAWYVNGVINSPPHNISKIWEAGQQSYPTLTQLAFSVGPLSILAFIGILQTFKRDSPLIRFGVTLVILSYIIFLSKIPSVIGALNLRFLFPAMYPFFGAMGALGIFTLARSISKIIRRFNQNVIVLLLIGLFMLASIPSINWELQTKVSANDPTSPLIYLPLTVAEGFRFLAARPPYSDVVVANPYSHMDSLAPALTGHTGFTGHMLTTIDSWNKSSRVISFLNHELDPVQARLWITQNNIRYILFTKYDGDISAFRSTYPFLISLYNTPDVTVFTIK